MSAATPTTADLDPEAAGSRGCRARHERLAARDSRATLLGSLAFVAVAVPFALLSPPGRVVSPGVLVLLVVAYAVAAQVEFEVGSGFAVRPGRLRAHAVPAPGRPRAAVRRGRVPPLRRTRCRPEADARGRALLEVFSAWRTRARRSSLARGRRAGPDVVGPPLLALVLLAQFAFDFASSAVEQATRSTSPLERSSAHRPVYLVDAALAPPASSSRSWPTTSRSPSCSMLPLLGLFAFFARERHRRIDHALRA